MDLARPFTAIAPTLDTAVLSFLAQSTRPMTGREVARKLEFTSHEGVRRVLNRLVEHGLVTRQEFGGSALLYILNRDHVAFPAVQKMAGIRTEFLRRLRKEFKDWDRPPEHASLYGSAARRDGDTKSDIDIFIIRPLRISESDAMWAGQTAELSENVLRWTGNYAGIAEFSVDEIASLVLRRPPVLEELLRDGINLYGDEISKIVRTHL